MHPNTHAITDPAFFRRLVEEAEEGIWVIDADNRTVYANARMAGMLGCSAADMLGRPLWDFMHPAARELAESNVERRRSGIREVHEFEFQRLDGSRFWAEVATAPLFRPEGEYDGTFAFITDITWRKATEQALSESEQAYREVFERSPAIKLMIDPANGQIVANNAAARSYYGYDADEFANLRIQQINTLTPAEIDAEMQRAYRQEREYFVFRHRLKNGELRDVEVHSHPISVGGRRLLYSIVQDIGRQRETEQRLRFIEFTVQQAHISVVWLNPDASIREANQYACRLLGYRRDQLIGMPIWEIDLAITPENWPQRWAQIETAGASSFRTTARACSGELIPIETHATHLAFDGGECIVTYSRNIFEQVQAEQLLALQHSVLSSIAGGESLHQVLNLLARSVEELAPETRCSVLLLDGDALRHGAAPSLPTAFTQAIDGVIIGPKVGSCGTAAYLNREVEVQDIASDPLWADYKTIALANGLLACWSSPIRASDGRVIGTFALYYHTIRGPDAYHRRVVTACTHLAGIAIEHREAEARVHALAFYDPLTGLPNRSLLADRVELALARAQRESAPLALLFVDLDRFKTINDSLGHAVGDRLLKTMAQRLEGIVRESDTVCRLGGDEFVLLLADCDAPGAAAVADKLIAAAAERIDIDGLSLNGSASVGIALYPNDGEDYDALLKHADAAMYRAKELGRNAFCFYQHDANDDAAARLALEAALRQALSRGELRLYYQPQISIADRQLHGLEALVRWQHPDWGMVSPARFIPIAEESGLIDAIGSWVLDEACRQLAAWDDDGLAISHISVNLSARQFRHDDIPAMVSATLARHGLGARRLTLEITESLMMVRDDTTLGALQALDAMGVALAVDDFGTGYSSLGYLKRFPVSELKLDQSFVRDLGEDEGDRALASAVVRIGQSLKLTVVAEGVETAAQLAFLHAEGCEVAQGYFFARPMPAADLPAWLAGQPGRAGALT